MFPFVNISTQQGGTCDPRPLLGGSAVSFDGVSTIDFGTIGTKYLTMLDTSNNLIEATITNTYTPSIGSYYNLKLWNNLGDYTTGTASDYITSGTFGFYKLDERSGSVPFRS